MKCIECDTEIELTQASEVGEIITCPTCGTEYELIINKDGILDSKEFVFEGEDWGE